MVRIVVVRVVFVFVFVYDVCLESRVVGLSVLGLGDEEDAEDGDADADASIPREALVEENGREDDGEDDLHAAVHGG